jgi:hypothetical protein
MRKEIEDILNEFDAVIKTQTENYHPFAEIEQATFDFLKQRLG